MKALQPSVQLYSSLFGIEPTLLKADYAKWMLDDPRVNFTISTRGHGARLDPLGVESSEEWRAVAARLPEARHPLVEQARANCCYAVR